MTEDAEYTIVGPADRADILAASPASSQQRYAVAFQLSGAPSRSWGDAFKDAYVAVDSPAKREARLSEDTITVFVEEQDDLQAVLDALKQGVMAANERQRRDLTAQAEHKASQEAELEHQRRTMSRLRDELDDLEF